MSTSGMFRHAILVAAVASVAAALALPSLANAQCLTGGDINICEDPVTGAAPGATVSGGTLLPGEGFRIDAKGDYITYDLGEFISAASIRFKVRGISEDALNGDTHLVMLLTDVPEINPPPPHLMEMKIWGSAVDPAAVGTLGLGPSDPSQETVKREQIPWDGSEYVFDITFDNATQRVSLARDGTSIIDYMTGDLIPGPDNPPIVMHYRYVHLALPCCLNNPAFQPVIGSTYTMFSIAATSEEPPASDGDGEEIEPLPEEPPAIEEAAAEELPIAEVTEIAEETASQEPVEDDVRPADEAAGTETGGCGCATATSPAARYPATLLLALLAVLLAARRRR